MKPNKLFYLLILLAIIPIGCTTTMRSRIEDNRPNLYQTPESEYTKEKSWPLVSPRILESVDPESQDLVFTDTTYLKSTLNPLPEFEELHYNVKWLAMTIGKMDTYIKGRTTINGREVYVFEITARTYSFFNSIYPIEDRMVSYMDVETLSSVRYEVYRQEGRYHKEAIIDFDQVNHKAYYEHLLNGEKKTIDIPPNVRDPLAAVYYFRMLPVGLGGEINYPVIINERIYELFGRIEDKKIIRFPKIGKMESLVMQPYGMVDGEEVKKMHVLGHFKNETLKTPIQTIVKAPLFTKLTVTLTPDSNDEGEDE